MQSIGHCLKGRWTRKVLQLLLSKVPMPATEPEMSKIPNDDINQAVKKCEGQNGLLFLAALAALYLTLVSE